MAATSGNGWLRSPYASTFASLPCPRCVLGGAAVVPIIPAVAIEAATRRWRGTRRRCSEISSQGMVVLIPTPEPGEVALGAHQFLARSFAHLMVPGLARRMPAPVFPPLRS